jgi:type VI protein secretion system component VasF
MAIDIDEFDFGFTAVDETELEAVQQSAESVNSAQSAALDNEEKLNKLYNAIQPLLSNLKKNPEKEYILWPNRTEKIEQFEDLIRKIISD